MGLVFTLAQLAAMGHALEVRSSDDMNPSSSSAIATPTLLTGFPVPTQYTLPDQDSDAAGRSAEIELKREGILYNDSLLGETSFFIGGPIGTQIYLQDTALWQQDARPVQEDVAAEAAAALAEIQEHGGLNTLEDFQILYEGHWSGSVPEGIAKGLFTNFTSDLLFSMERLSTNPYILHRLDLRAHAIPFPVDEAIVQNLTGTALETLFQEGRLFLADHSYQSEYTPQQGRYAAACQALFYIDNRTDQFLPLAIKTNAVAGGGVGSDSASDLTYTPLDDANDWLLAKIMFNVNDFFHGQIYHLANSHAVAEIVNLAALRTLSSRHPVSGLLARLMYQAYAPRVAGEKILFNDGGPFDQNFAFSNKAARKFATDSWASSTGPFEPNYFESNLRSRGLLGAEYGPELPHFPFYEDGSRILRTIRTFIETFVEATYESGGGDGDGGDDDQVLATDSELQAWFAEAHGPAKVIDFPSADASPLAMRKQLVDILTHMAWLTGVSHHVLNQGEPVTASAVLPLHPASLYAPVPTQKGGIESLMPWLPNATMSVDYIALVARFNRPAVVENNHTLLHMFDVESLLSGTGEAVAAANVRFMRDMAVISEEIRTRRFDSEGLSQGMPFIWTGMDPGAIPFYLSI